MLDPKHPITVNHAYLLDRKTGEKIDLGTVTIRCIGPRLSSEPAEPIEIPKVSITWTFRGRAAWQLASFFFSPIIVFTRRRRSLHLN